MERLFDKLTEYGASDFYPYHMPGHKRQAINGLPGCVAEMDITEITDFDNLHQAEGILLEAQRYAAKAYGVEESFFLINGSTCGILSAVSAAVPFGGHLLIARNCHKSVYHAAYLRKLKLSYIYPDMNIEFDLCEAVTPQQVEKCLTEDSSIQAVLIVSPTYEGRIADVKAIAEVVHGKGIPLIVDEAHGAHLGFCEGFALNSGRLGADLVINSVHKTLPALTQTALLHCSGNLINRNDLKKFLHIYQSSSPSYIMMASIDHAVRTAEGGKALFQSFLDRWQKMLDELKKLQRLKILPERVESFTHDIGKLIISTKAASISGRQLADMLRENYHLETEMACETYVLAMFTIADTQEGYARLTTALLEIDSAVNCLESACVDEQIHIADQRRITDQRLREGMAFYKAWDVKKRQVSLADAEGCMAGEFINLYPPGTPIVVPGEILTDDVIRRICNCLDVGLDVQGICEATDGSREADTTDKMYVISVLMEA